MRSQVDNK